MIFLTSPGKTYSVNSISGCTVSVGGTTLTTIPANVQTTFIAPEDAVIVSDNNAIIVEVTGVGAGGSGGSGEGGSGGVTAEEIKAVVPMVFGEYTTAPSCDSAEGIAIGDGAYVEGRWGAIKGIAIGSGATAEQSQAVAVGDSSNASSLSVAVGSTSKAKGFSSIAIGFMAGAEGSGLSIGRQSHAGDTSSSLGYRSITTASRAVTVGQGYYENVEGTSVNCPCTTEGTGSITIGAGANTLNNGDTESSNSVTIGCKAENKGADSVVIGAQAKNPGAPGGVYIGARATTTRTQNPSVAIGRDAKCGLYGVSIGVGANSTGDHSVMIGYGANSKHMLDVCLGLFSTAEGSHAVAVGSSTNAGAQFSTAIGSGSQAKAKSSTAIGANATVNDVGATVIRSTAEDGTYTQLYFSGANTPLANTYENGEAMMGYVVRDKSGNIMTDAEGNAMVGTQKLSVLFPNNRGENAFTPAMLGLDDEWTPKPMFRPSDLDMPQEEPTEPEEYQPLPVYPIVEPEIEETPSES
jgi:hypothetical protein